MWYTDDFQHLQALSELVGGWVRRRWNQLRWAPSLVAGRRGRG